MGSTADAYREKQEHSTARAVFVLDDPMTGDDSSNEPFLGAAPPTTKTGSAHINDRPSKRGLRHRRSPFSLAGKRFPDAAKHSMVPGSLWLGTRNIVKSKA
jgi:hypothetical protein